MPKTFTSPLEEPSGKLPFGGFMTVFKRTRVVEAAMAILQATSERQLGITVMNKALFYSDLCALRDIGKTITHGGYVALPQGPVLNHYERSLIRELEKQGLAEQVTDGWERPLVVRCELEKFEMLDREEIGIAQLVARKIHGKSAGWVSDYSHENDAWVKAFRQKTGTPIDMILALQQVVEDDPWVSEPLDQDVRRALSAAHEEGGVPF